MLAEPEPNLIRSREAADLADNFEGWLRDSYWSIEQRRTIKMVVTALRERSALLLRPLT